MLGREVYRVFSELTEMDVVGAHREADGGIFELLDAEDPDSGRRLIAKISPNLIINCTGILASMIEPEQVASVKQALVVNSVFPLNLALTSVEHGARFIHISTDGIFRKDAGICFEDSKEFANDYYAVTKRLGEPQLPNTISLRCSIIGMDKRNHRGMIEWCRGHERGTSIKGFVDHVWNGLTTRELAVLLTRLSDGRVFDQVRRDSHVHHVSIGSPMTKFELVSTINEALQLDLEIQEVESGEPISRTIRTRFTSLSGLLPKRDSLQMAIRELRP